MIYCCFMKTMERFHSCGQKRCKFIRTKESVYTRKEFKSHRISLVHQYGCRDIMWKRPICSCSWPAAGQILLTFATIPISFPSTCREKLCCTQNHKWRCRRLWTHPILSAASLDFTARYKLMCQHDCAQKIGVHKEEISIGTMLTDFPPRPSILPPTILDWAQATVIHSYLRCLYSNLLKFSPSPTFSLWMWSHFTSTDHERYHCLIWFRRSWQWRRR